MKTVKRTYFTLVEVLVSMAVFTVLMLALIGFFNSAQKVFSESTRKAEMYENARLALDMITRDIQSVYYENGKIPFWHKPKTDDGVNSNEMLCYVSSTNIEKNDTNNSGLFEIKYQLYYTNSPTDNLGGWLRRSITADDTGGWDFYNKFSVGSTGSDKVFTHNTDSSQEFDKIIPYVTNINFTCYDKAGNIISDKWKSSDSGKPAYATYDYSTSVSPFPYSIKVDLSLLDKSSWQKWIALGAVPNDCVNDSDSTAAKEFRKKNERTFSKTVFIGDRGQYD